MKVHECMAKSTGAWSVCTHEVCVRAQAAFVM